MKLIISTQRIQAENDCQVQQPNAINNLTNNYYSEVDITDTLDFLSDSEREMYLKMSVSKIRSGGKFFVKGVDLGRVAMKIMNKTMKVDSANQTLYNGRRSVGNHEQIKAQLMQSGMKIVRTYFENEFYYIEAEKNEPHTM